MGDHRDRDRIERLIARIVEQGEPPKPWYEAVAVTAMFLGAVALIIAMFVALVKG